MTNLEQYIKDNPGLFDTEEPEAGHEERFMARLESRPLRPVLRWITGFAAAAAVLLSAMVFVPKHEEPKATDWFAAIGDDPESVYKTYLARYETVCLELSRIDEESTLEAITMEAIPLIDQLPEELTAQEKAEILKDYYGDILDAVELFKNKLNIR